jgi:hypothetical protein
MVNGVLLEPGTYGRRAIITAPWRDEMASALVEANIRELDLNDGKGWRGSELSFLTSLPQLQSLTILDLTISHIDEIHLLRELRELEVITYCDTKISFSAFPFLQRCSLQWRAGAASLFECSSLKHLFVDGYSGKDVLPFTKLANLESLAILNAPIESLEGLSALKNLVSLRLGRLIRLKSLAGIEGLKNLEALEIQRCWKIGSIEQVAGLIRLRTLFVNDSGEIESLQPLTNLKRLESVMFYESTNILDGDLSPLTQLPKLSEVSFRNRKHYSHRREEIRFK